MTSRRAHPRPARTEITPMGRVEYVGPALGIALRRISDGEPLNRQDVTVLKRAGIVLAADTKEK